MTRQLVPYAGVPFELAGEWKIIPALNLKLLKAHKDDLAKLLEIEKQANTDPDGTLLHQAVAIASPVILACLRRNYPDTTPEQLDESIDLSNYHAIMKTIMGQSGFKLVRAVEDASSGEAAAAGSQT